MVACSTKRTADLHFRFIPENGSGIWSELLPAMRQGRACLDQYDQAQMLSQMSDGASRCTFEIEIGAKGGFGGGRPGPPPRLRRLARLSVGTDLALIVRERVPEGPSVAWRQTVAQAGTCLYVRISLSIQ
jgi:hypothetical protein